MVWKSGRFSWIMLLGLALAVAGCATPDTGPITRQIASVETMIQQARQAKAEDYAPLALKRAEENLEAARTALEEKEVDRAGDLAEKAMFEARKAQTRAEAERSQERVESERKDVDMLRQEIDRAQGVE